MAHLKSPQPRQTVREALDEKRQQLKKMVIAIVVCKRELFYITANGVEQDSVYPVSLKTAAAEAEFFGVPCSNE